MHNRVLNITLFIIFISVYAFNLLSKDMLDSRPLAKRIHNIEHYSSDMMSQYSSIRTYYYGDNNTILVDSILVHNSNNNGGQITTSDNIYTYTHSINTIDNLKHINYLEFYNHSTLPTQQISFIVEPLGRLLDIQKTTFSGSGEVVSRYSRSIHYNNYGKPDSVYYESYYNSNLYTHIYILYYDTSNRLTRVMDYSLENNLWILKNRNMLTYEENIQPNANPLQIIEYSLQSVRYNLFNLYSVVDTQYIPQTIISEYWTGSAWMNSYYLFDAYMSNEWICIYEHFTDIYSGGSIYRFSDQGIYGGYNFGTPASEYSEGDDITWEDYVPNEDEHQGITPALMTINTYPNPFKSSLNIKLTDNSNAPSDIAIYNIKGQLVRKWDKVKSSELIWDGKDNANQPVSSGMYLIRARQGKTISSAKIVKY